MMYQKSLDSLTQPTAPPPTAPLPTCRAAPPPFCSVDPVEYTASHLQFLARPVAYPPSPPTNLYTFSPLFFVCHTILTTSMPKHEDATKAQALTLKLMGYSTEEIETITGIPPRTLNNMYQGPIERGLQPSKKAKILSIYIKDTQRSGSPLNRHQRSVKIGLDERKAVLRSL